MVRFLYLLALVVWVGEIICFSLIVAPVVFRILGSARAGDVVGAIFPIYYQVGIAAAAVSALCALVLGRRAGWPTAWVGSTAAILLGLVLIVSTATVAHPRAQRLRAAAQEAGLQPSESPAFRRAHGLAFALNAAALAAGVAALGFSAAALRR